MNRTWLHVLINADPNRLNPFRYEDEEAWYRAALHDDSYGYFTHWTLKSVYGGGLVLPASSGIGLDVKDEKELLTRLWAALADIRQNSMTLLSGWRVTDIIWPKLISRSMHLDVDICDEMRPLMHNPAKKFGEGGFYDLYNAYKQGVYDRPEVRLDELLEFWTGEETMSALQLARECAKVPPAVDVIAALDRQVDLMEEVARRYDG
jgi:hypothetical protein